MEIISTISLISINETIVVQLVSFLIFLFLINRIMFKPLHATIKQREVTIDNIEAEIRAANETLAKISRDMREAEQEAVLEATLQKKNFESAGTAEAEKLIASALEQVRLMRKKTQAEIDRQIELARTRLAADAQNIALEIFAKILDRKAA